MTPEMIGQDILWFFEGAAKMIIPAAILILAMHLHYKQ
jgi:hypothetical protein